jgi:hypothetical protein
MNYADNESSMTSQNPQRMGPAGEGAQALNIPEGMPEWDPLLPYAPEDLTLLQDRLTALTVADIHSFVAVRHEGPSHHILTALYHAGYSEWHAERGRLKTPDEKLFHELGLLYGVQMLDHRHRDFRGEALVADSLAAYDAADRAVRASYSLDLAPDTPRWRTEKEREIKHTGSDSLSILNALLQNVLLDRFNELHPDLPEVPTDDAMESFYTGLIDASIFYNTYARQKVGLEQEVFSNPSVHAPAFDEAIHVEAALPAQHLLPARLDHVLASIPEAEVWLPQKGREPAVVGVKPVMAQTGINEFIFCGEVIETIPLSPTIDLQRMFTLSVSALGGCVSGLAVEFAAHPDTTHLPRPYQIGAVIGGLVGILWEGARETCQLTALTEKLRSVRPDEMPETRTPH